MTFGAPRNAAHRSSRADGSDTQSQDSLRARARRRLIGAVALVLLGVIVFPLVFDSKPKPVPSNIALDIPSQSKAPALSLPASAPVLATASAAAVPPPEHASDTKPAISATSAPGKAAPAAPQAGVPQAASAAAPAAAKPEVPQLPAKSAVSPKPPAASAQSKEIASARQALAALEGKPVDQITLAQVQAALAHKAQVGQQDATPSRARYVVQAGAYADAHAAQVVRNKIEAAGLKTYTQVVDTPQGKRVRVRVGPFASREEAERALRKLQGLGLGGVVLTL